jgi:hypothetical protein
MDLIFYICVLSDPASEPLIILDHHTTLPRISYSYHIGNQQTLIKCLFSGRKDSVVDEQEAISRLIDMVSTGQCFGLDVAG